MAKNGNDSDIQKWAIITTIAIVILWSLTFFGFKYFTTPEERGTFGDMFGAVNALFSGLAFAGIIITIILQSRELRLQRQELSETRIVFEEQTSLMSKQQKDATFFNLLQNHRQLIESFNAGKWKIGSGGNFGERVRQSYTEAVSGYEVLERIDNKWKRYFEIYSESYKSKRILDLNIHEYLSYKELINSDQIAHVLFRELRNIHSYIDNNLEYNSEFYKETLIHSLTSQEIFLFETLYCLYPNERKNIKYYSSNYFNEAKYVNFSKCQLPAANAATTYFKASELWISVETNGSIKSGKMLVYNTENEFKNVSLTDIVELKIGDNYGLNVNGFNHLDIYLNELLIKSNLDIHQYPFTNRNALSEQNLAFDIEIEYNEELYHFYFAYTFNTHEYTRSRVIKKFEISNPGISEISQNAYQEIYQEILVFKSGNRLIKPVESITDRINNIIEKFFNSNPDFEEIISDKLMLEFFEADIFKTKKKQEIKEFLIKLDKSNELYKIPFANERREGNQSIWYFVNQ